jgi:hypothetical protein
MLEVKCWGRSGLATRSFPVSVGELLMSDGVFEALVSGPLPRRGRAAPRPMGESRFERSAIRRERSPASVDLPN